MKKSWLSSLQAFARDTRLARTARRRMIDAKKMHVGALESLEARQLLTGDFSGSVFNDLNVNGINDPGEPGLAGWTVFADTNRDGQFNTGEPNTVTDVKGKFAITGLPAGAITFYEVVQPGFNPTPGFTNHQTITIRDGRAVKADFPNITAPIVNGSITGTVFEDDNENGIKESGEHGLTGWTMFVDTNLDGQLSPGEPTTLTNTDGDYLFTDIPAGSAVVYEIPVGGPRPTVGGLFPREGASDHHPVTVVAGRSVRTDFSNILPQVGSIQGVAWSDTNGDGFRGVSESPLANRPVYIDLNNNGILEATEPSRLTDASGAYAFTNIRTGSYRVSEVVPAGWEATEGRPASVTTTVFIGGLNVVDFFNLIPVAGSISGSLWDDADGNGVRSSGESGLAEWQVYLDLNTNGIRDAVEPQFTTNSDGSYIFTNVSYGTKTVREIVPANWFATNPSTGATTFRVLSGENNTGVNFGNRERVGSIKGSVWSDTNGDRLHSATETGLSDWTVYLDLNSDGVKDASEPSVISDAKGNYVFNRVPLGTYRVTEVVPAGWVTAVGKPNSVPATVVLGGVHVVDYYNLVPVTGTISGTVFGDPDANGSMAISESGLEGWKVYADLNGNGSPDASEPSAITDATGLYTIPGVPYGNVTIREVITPGYRATNLTAGLSTLLLNGENRTGVDFGNLELSEFVISGTAFSDSNRNGTLDAGERGLSGITVYIDTNNNSLLDAGEPSTVTLTDRFFTPDVNETGTYSFSHLARGSYTVREIVPPDQLPTPAAARVQSVTVPSFTSSNANFANIFRENEIHGVVYDDTDADGVRDSGEYARPGVSVYIDVDRDDVCDADEPEAVTGSDGTYSFTGLTPGAYIVREKSGFVGPHTYPTTGGGILWPTGVSHAAVGNVTPTSITTSLAQGESYSQTVSITLPGTGSISNMVDVFLLFDDTGSFTANSPIVRAAFPTIISTLQASLPGIDLGFGVGRFEEYGSFASEVATGRPFILNQPIVESTRPGFATSIQAALDRMAPGYGGDGPETDIEALYQVVTGLGFDGNNNGSVSESGAAGLASTQLNPGNSGDVPAFSSFTPDPANNVLAAAGNVGGAGFRPGALPVILTATDIGFAYQPHGESTISGAGGVTLPVSSLTQMSRPTTPFSSGAGLQETVTGLNALGALVIGLGTNPLATTDPRQGLESLATLTGAVNQSSTTIANGTADPIAPGDPFYFQISSGFGSTVADGVTSAIQNAVTNVAMDITLRSSDPRVRIINHTGTLTGIGGGQTASFDVEFIGDGRPSRFDLQFVRQGTEVVLGSIPVVLGTPVAGDAYSYDDLEDGEVHRSSHFGNYVANVAPSFTAGGDQLLSEDAGTTNITGWATEINAGSATEAGQTLNFVVTNSNPALFSVQPSVAADGTLTFTPAAHASGQAVVTVVLQDNGGVGLSGADTSVSQSFLIDIAAVNDAPVVAADSYSLFQDSSVTTAAPGVLANDFDVEGSALTARLTSSPAHGTVVFNSDGSFVYTPTAGFQGTDSFTYVANDGLIESAAATVSLTVNRINSAPVAVDDAFSVNEDTPLNVALPGVLTNDTDADGDVLRVVKVIDPRHGIVVLNSDGSFDYTPSLNFRGLDTFTYLVNDGSLNSSIATVTINVINTNHAPVAGDDAYSTAEDTPLSMTLPGVLGNDTDADSDPLTALRMAGPTHGTVTLNSDGTFLYTPAANFNGIDSFTYLTNDGSVDSNVATVTITVGAVNDAPVAVSDSYTTSEDTPLNVLTGILINDSDVDGDALTIVKLLDPTHGTLTLNTDGTFQYVPAANYSGSDNFTYFVTDGSLNSNTVNVTLTVTPVNDTPVAVNESYAINEDSPLSVSLPGVLANDSDTDGNLLSATRVTGPAHGTLTLNANGSFLYVPAPNYNGTDSFTYRASDGTLTSNLATVTITIASVNDAPFAGNDNYSIDQDGVLNITPRGVLLNDSDADGDILSAAIAVGPTHGTLVLNSDGSFRYAPTPGFSGTDSFTYRASDAFASSAAATVTLTVIPFVPRAKFFVADSDRGASFQYLANGSSLSSNALNKSDSKPRGIASNSTGTIQWVIDLSGVVFIYNNTGGLLGQWTPLNVGKPEGITVWGNDLWLVDPASDKVFKFTGGAALRTGKIAATSSFALNSGNLNSTDLVTDGAHLWVVNDTLAADKVFRYTTAGVLEGSWSLSTTNPSPTGITIDPNDVNHIWVVDASTDKVYQYNNAITRLNGSQEPAATFALAATNTNPQGIADPLSTGPGLAASTALPVTLPAAKIATFSMRSTLASQKTEWASSFHDDAAGPMTESAKPETASLRDTLSAQSGHQSRASRRQDSSREWSSSVVFTEDSRDNSPSLQELDDLFSDVGVLL